MSWYEEGRRAANRRLTSQQKGGAVGTKLSPEAGQGGVDSRSNVEEDSISGETKQLQPEATNLWVVHHSSSQPVPNQGHSTVQQCPQQGLLQIWTAEEFVITFLS